MQVITQCRDCNYYIARDFKCNLNTGYAHHPKDYCLLKGHIFEIPQCLECKYYNIRGLFCEKINNYMKPKDFCSWGEYRE